MGEKPVVRIGHLKTVDHLVLGLAASGPLPWGRELAHMYLEPVSMNAWNQVVERVRDKTIDGAFLPAPAAMDLISAGADIKILFQGPGSGAGLVKRLGADIKTVADFRGRTILVPHALSIHTLLVHRLMASAGLKAGAEASADVVLEPMAPAMMIEALEYDREAAIGGFIAPEPFGTLAVESGLGAMVCKSETLWPGHPSSVFVLRNAVITAYPDAVFELVRNLVDHGSRPNDLVSAAVSFLDQDPQVVEKVIGKQEIGQAGGCCLPDIKTLEIILDYMRTELGRIGCETDVAGCLELSFARKTGVVR
ncbi:MAG: ABC transporter substrate-binding protein [Desulfobacteraceae bacterium]|nr:ABC transporter substrate-binding protein [Desulfobacteraceae bacterium]